MQNKTETIIRSKEERIVNYLRKQYLVENFEIVPDFVTTGRMTRVFTTSGDVFVGGACVTHHNDMSEDETDTAAYRITNKSAEGPVAKSG